MFRNVTSPLLHLLSFFPYLLFPRIYYFYFMCMFYQNVCKCIMCVHAWYSMRPKNVSGAQNCRYRCLWVILCMVGTEPGSLHEQPKLLIPTPPLFPLELSFLKQMWRLMLFFLTEIRDYAWLYQIWWLSFWLNLEH